MNPMDDGFRAFTSFQYPTFLPSAPPVPPRRDIGPTGVSPYAETLNTGLNAFNGASPPSAGTSAWNQFATLHPTSAQIGAITQGQMAQDAQDRQFAQQRQMSMDQMKMQAAMQAWLRQQDNSQALELQRRNAELALTEQARNIGQQQYGQKQSQLYGYGWA